MQHVEFFHIDHFANNYHRVAPAPELRQFIDFFWETRFDALWKKHPRGFSDALFPNIGYTYLINLGTPFVMQVNDKKFPMKSDGFLPRHRAIECYHSMDNRLFGIKFKISPVLLERPVNFSEYREFIYPLSYLMEPAILTQVKAAPNFNQRVNILNTYFTSLVNKPGINRQAVDVVSAILRRCEYENDFNTSVTTFAAQYGLSPRTLHRYFEMTTSLSSKKALQILRIRKATEHLATDPATFHFTTYGYYDHSHFYKHLRSFLQKDTLRNLEPHLLLLRKLRSSK